MIRKVGTKVGTTTRFAEGIAANIAVFGYPDALFCVASFPSDQYFFVVCPLNELLQAEIVFLRDFLQYGRDNVDLVFLLVSPAAAENSRIR